MQAFRFRLNSVVRIREMQLRKEESKLEEFFRERSRLEAEMVAQREALQQAWDSNRSVMVLSSTELAAVHSLEEKLRRDTVVFRSRLAAQEELIAKQQAVVVEIRRALRLLEQLKSERLSEWQREADRELAALVDDTTNSQRMRRRLTTDA